jgi:hypothetical protein
MPRALISVSDKRGILSFAEELVRLGWEVVSTGGTAALLRQGGVPVTSVDQVTGFPEILDGRVKTLHPASRTRSRISTSAARRCSARPRRISSSSSRWWIRRIIRESSNF